MAQGVPPDAADQITADAGHRVATTGPKDATWRHLHSGAITLTLADPNLDARRAHFMAQQRLRAAQVAYGTLRQAQHGTPEQQAAALQSAEALLAASGAVPAGPAGQTGGFDTVLNALRQEWLPHLMAKERQARRDALTAVYGTPANPPEDPLLGQLTATDLAAGRLAAERAGRLGLTDEAYWQRLAEAKWHNDRLSYLQAERKRVQGTKVSGRTSADKAAAQAAKDDRLKELGDQIRQTETNRAHGRREAQAAELHCAAPSTSGDDAYAAGLRYGQELQGVISEMVHSILRSALDC